MGSLSLMGKASFREPFQSGLQDVRFVPYGDADALEYEFQRCEAVGVQIAGVVLEPVQGEAGGVVPPPDYFPRARELCTRYGALLIADEIQTGMGRTGKLWGVDHWNVVPDIMCLGKSIGGGVMPLSAFISTPAIWEVMIPNPIIHSTTFGGNPLACAAARTVIDVVQRDRLAQRAADLGAKLIERLRAFAADRPDRVEAVRGRGLLVGMALRDPDRAAALPARALERGVLVNVAAGRVVRLVPALHIPESDLFEGVERVLALAAD